MSMVFVAGPLSGLIMQPVIGPIHPSSHRTNLNEMPFPLGALSDRCTSKFGRRRPFMMLGCSICFISLLLLGYTKHFTLIFGLITDAVCSTLLIPLRSN